MLQNIGKVYIPKKVLLETESYLSVRLETKISFLELFNLSENELSEVQKLMRLNLLQEGEAEVIILARKIQADWFITDDTAARVTAAFMQMEVHGSLGIILWNVSNRKITPEFGIEAMHKIRNTSLWISNKIFMEAINAIQKFAKESD